jgi:arylsulfatase
MAAAAAAFLRSLAVEPPIKPGTSDPYKPPKRGEFRPEEHIQLGVITQFVTTLVKAKDELSQPDTGMGIQTG